MLHAADVINFIFFCMHALQPPGVILPSATQGDFVAEVIYKSNSNNLFIFAS
jgi:hypothetical protein